MTQQSHCWAYTPRKQELKETYGPVFTAGLFMIARTQKQPRCPSPDEWIKKLWYIYNGILLISHWNASESVLMRWMNLEPIIQSEVGKRKTDTVY